MNQIESIKSNKFFIHIFEPSQPISGFEYINLESIDSILEQSAESIYINDLLDYIHSDSVYQILTKLKSKLKDGGKLYIQGIDIKSASISLLYGQISMSIFKSMVYGLGKRSTYTTSDIKEILQDIDGLKIISVQYINASQYYIECSRYE